MAWKEELAAAEAAQKRGDDEEVEINLIILGMRLLNAMGSLAFGMLFLPIWIILGLLTAITVVGFPLSKYIFRLCAFWKDGFYVDFSEHPIANGVWRCTFGIIMSIIYALVGIASFTSLILIPLGIKYFEKIPLIFTPFGAETF